MSTCPAWCTRTHRPGANPNRQKHEHRFVPTEKGSSEGVYTAYPAASWHDHIHPAMMFGVDVYGRWVRFVLTRNDLVNWIDDLRAMVEHLDADQAAIDHRKVYGGEYA